MKIIFSNIYKNIFFKDKIFQKIKKSFIIKYRNKIGLDLRTKQLEYPSTEKNFSNSLEPKFFLRRDYNFYKNDFFPISHEYINNKLINDRDDNKLFFYRHEFKRDINNENKKEFKCELITNQFLYFGKFVLHKDYIYFKSEQDPREKNPKERVNIYSNYIFSLKDKENTTKKEKEILMFIKDIKEIIRKRTLLMKQSLEIFNKNGKSYFFNFFKIKECDQICDILQKECGCIIEDGNKDSIESKLQLFKKGEISNYEYLLYLNKYSTRTYNDLSQYPIFPWLVNDIGELIQDDDKKFFGESDIKSEISKAQLKEDESSKLSDSKEAKSERAQTLTKEDIISKSSDSNDGKSERSKTLIINRKLSVSNDEKSEKSKKSGKSEDTQEELDANLRNMKFPISMQNSLKRLSSIQKFKEDKISVNFPFHLGTHYSTSSYIFYYMMRNNPYCNNMIKLQNYKQENPNRMFLSFKYTQNILLSSTDNRELIPDMFCYIDFLINLNCAFFGERNNNLLVDDFSILEEYQEDTNKNYNLISDFMKYLYVHKKLLNSSKTSKRISQWVDIIFGKKQFPEKRDEKAESCNIFSKLTYEQYTKLNEKLNKYIKIFEKDENKDKKSLEKNLMNKIQNKINIIISSGVCPCQILTETVYCEAKPHSINKKKN